MVIGEYSGLGNSFYLISEMTNVDGILAKANLILTIFSGLKAGATIETTVLS